MTSIMPVTRVRSGVLSEIPDVRIKHVASGFSVKVSTGLLNSAITIEGEQRYWGNALELTYDGVEIKIRGGKSAMQVGQELQARLAEVTGGYVNGNGTLKSYTVRVAHI